MSILSRRWFRLRVWRSRMRVRSEAPCRMRRLPAGASRRERSRAAMGRQFNDGAHVHQWRKDGRVSNAFAGAKKAYRSRRSAIDRPHPAKGGRMMSGYKWVQGGLDKLRKPHVPRKANTATY